MSLLYSNYPPLKTQSSTYHDTFKDLIEVADRLSIATGYISADAVVDLRNIVEINNGPFLQLNIGMHYFEGLTLQQKQALEDLDNLLRQKDLGGVYMVVTFPFHGKLMSFTKSARNVGSLIGSSNLTNIIENKTNRQYEVDYLLKTMMQLKSVTLYQSSMKLPQHRLPKLELRSFSRKIPCLMTNTELKK